MPDQIPPRPRGRPPNPRPSRLDVADPLLTSHESAAEAGVSIAAWWKGVRELRFPAPFYVTPATPRWRRSEIKAAVEATRARPREAVARRRAAKLASDD